METQHPFEKAGLGKAPFRYIGAVFQEKMYGQAVVGNAGGIPITTQPGGSCAYCGAYIINMFNIESSDGKVFHVGSDCVMKVAAESPKTMSDIQNKVKKAVNANVKKRLSQRAIEAKAFYATPETQWWITNNIPQRAADHLDFCMRKAGDSRVISEINRLKKQMTSK